MLNGGMTGGSEAAIVNRCRGFASASGWRRLAMAGLIALLVGGCATDRLAVADYRMEPYRPAVDRAPAAAAPAAAAPEAAAPEAAAPEAAAEPVATADVPAPTPAASTMTEEPTDAAVASSEPVADATVVTGARILRPGSRVEVRLRGIPEPESFADQVDDRGEITLPHLGSVRVAGLATSQAERHIERTYVERRIFRSVNVIITTDEEEYFVQGEVRRPGKYMVTRNLTLMQAISEAGGFTPFADRRRVRVMRETGDATVHNARDIADGSTVDPPIQAKDVIDVPRSIW